MLIQLAAYGGLIDGGLEQSLVELGGSVSESEARKASLPEFALALQKLEADKLVVSRVEQQDGKPAKKVYSITELGRREFISSLFDQLGEDEYRSEFLLFARFASELPQSLVQVRLRERLASLDAAIAELDRLESNHSQPADRWIIDYGRSCMAYARDYIDAHMGELIALARPDAAQAAE